MQALPEGAGDEDSDAELNAQERKAKVRKLANFETMSTCSTAASTSGLRGLSVGSFITTVVAVCFPYQ